MLIEMARDEVAAVIEAVILEQLVDYREELTSGQMKLIASECSREAVRRLGLAREGR